ncbi:MAG: rod shape-determining protein MreC [Tissierellaceae bacterium]|jgi:rod shape-determining protein MreC|nr:rod shape-determining protein MreC [Tissierellia bacterium]
MYFFRKYKNRMMVTAVAIILILIIGFTNKDRLSVSTFENLMGNIFKPVNKVVYSIGNRVSGFFSSIKNISRLSEENEELLAKVAALEDENRDLNNLIGKYDFLKNEAGLLQNTSYDLISAQITGKDPGNWYDVFTIDKGLNHGLKKNDNVIQGIETENGVIEEGLIGRIADIGSNWAKVISIIDEQNKVSFKIIRTQDGGMLNGKLTIDGTIEGYLFDSEADVIPGDKVFTSGLGEVFKEDIYIGEVAEVHHDDEELIMRITVDPAINFKKLYKVLVIRD